MKYKQLTSEERYTISGYRKTGLSVTQIAKEMNRQRSTIYREIRRHLRQGAYRPSWAVTKAHVKRSKARRGFQYSTEDLEIVGLLLRSKWSPEQISGSLKRSDLLSISHETIYKYVWWDKSKVGSLYKYLRQYSKKRRKRYRAFDSRGLLAGKRHISKCWVLVISILSLSLWNTKQVIP